MSLVILEILFIFPRNTRRPNLTLSNFYELCSIDFFHLGRIRHKIFSWSEQKRKVKRNHAVCRLHAGKRTEKRSSRRQAKKRRRKKKTFLIPSICNFICVNFLRLLLRNLSFNCWLCRWIPEGKSHIGERKIEDNVVMQRRRKISREITIQANCSDVVCMKLKWNTFKDENVRRSKIYGKRKRQSRKFKFSKHIDRQGRSASDVDEKKIILRLGEVLNTLFYVSHEKFF